MRALDTNVLIRLLADIFIGLCARETGCETTLTFDEKASKSGLFRRL